MTQSGKLAEKISSYLATHGLILRGGFNFTPGEDAPPGPSGAAAESVVLVGSAGSGWWPHFQHWREGRPTTLSDPLDAWSRRILADVTDQFAARLVMPSDKPYAPFQSWAMRAEGLRPSPLGILIHPEYGLWHAYRGALLFDVELPIQAPETPIHLCDACAGKPCLKACPVDAYSTEGFAHDRCLSHVRAPAGAPCREGGCLDRNACPYGEHWRYPAEVQTFFQRAFAL